jgi:SAM-dependent methyltransferase
VPGPDATDPDVALSQLAPEAKAQWAQSFGEVAPHYERYRPGPPAAAVDWLLPGRVDRAVDLGAGTGALTRLLVERADEVVAVEPDDRMRSVLVAEVPGVRTMAGRGESIPLPDASADAVVASSSWHWMDPVPALTEVGRVLVPGGVLGVLWSGPDPEGPFLAQARAILAPTSEQTPAAAGSTLEQDGPLATVLSAARRPDSTLEIPAGVPFHQPEEESFRWDVALNADDLVGLLGTFSWVITMSEDERQRLFADTRRLLRQHLGVEGDVTVDVTFRCVAWRTHRQT